jgi:hypothetical protein
MMTCLILTSDIIKYKNLRELGYTTLFANSFGTPFLLQI